MVRYPDKFHIQPMVEVKKGLSFDYVDSGDPKVFQGRIRKSMGRFDSSIQGDLTKATHTINCPLLDFPLKMGQTVYEYSTEKSYELIFFIVGQKACKLWVALS